MLMSVSFKGTSANNWTSAVSASFGFDRASEANISYGCIEMLTLYCRFLQVMGTMGSR